jgi:hypothetical protein
MTQDEFIRQMNSLEHQEDVIRQEKAELKQRFLTSQPIPAKQVVEVDGRKVYLLGYRLIGYHIHPVFLKLNKKGERSNLKYNAVDEKTMRRVE